VAIGEAPTMAERDLTLPFAVLDLSPIPAGQTAAEALRNSLDLARQAERLGYRRYWLAEHHNMPGIASAATAVVIAHIAGGTKTIRVGSGGIMLPNHSPLVIAEQFGTLAALFPGRIDLGLGRAPGTDGLTARALRRDLMSNAESFPNDVVELRGYFAPEQPGQKIRAVPGAGLKVPLWILGSSLYGAQVAALLGLPYAFASHFAPDGLLQALELYRERFEPSEQLARPYAMAACNVIAADSAERARLLFTSQQQAFVNLRRGTPGPFPAPVADLEAVTTPLERDSLARTLRYSFVGTPDEVADGLKGFVAMTGIDEVMISGPIFHHAERVRSFELAAGLRAGTAAEAAA
jgi:luciferase family oxidoreductase group 1